MTHPDPLDLLRRALVLHGSRAAEPPGPLCLDDDSIAALAEGSLDAAARAAAIPHLADCSRCRSAVASVARALAESTVAREAAAVEGFGRRRLYRIALPVAAAAVLLVLVWSPQRLDDGRPPHRSPTITAAAAPVLVSPVGTVASVAALRWASVSGADRYRVTLYETGGAVLYETQLADTVAAFPDSVILVPGRLYLWKVEARTGWDRWTTSEVVEFRIAGGAPR